jgi:hypothetical protein
MDGQAQLACISMSLLNAVADQATIRCGQQGEIPRALFSDLTPPLLRRTGADARYSQMKKAKIRP